MANTYKGTRFKVTDRVKRSMRYLYAGWSAESIGRQLHVAGRTVINWMSRPEYQEAYKRYSEKFSEIENDRLERLEGIAVDTLDQLMARAKNEGVRERLAVAFLKGRGKLVEKQEVEVSIKEVPTEELQERGGKIAQGIRDKILRRNGQDSPKRTSKDRK